MTQNFKSHAKVGVYVDAANISRNGANISRNGGQRMQYDVLREFACRDHAEPLRLNVYLLVLRRGTRRNQHGLSR